MKQVRKKIIITGGTGFLGSMISQRLLERGDQVIILTRSVRRGKQLNTETEFVEWDYRDPSGWKNFIEGADAIIHLAGANLFAKRWNRKYKKIILESREASTKNLSEVINHCKKKPEVFVSSSAVGYYGPSGEKILTETAPPGKDFLSEVCQKWESAAAETEKEGVRQVSVRTGLVLSRKEGTLKKMIPPFKLFVGGALGSGKQWFPWIHIDDLISIYLFCLDTKISGAVNAGSPNPVRMEEFAAQLGKVLKRPSFFNVPGFVLKIILGEFADAVTASLRVIPEKLNRNNFEFKFPDLQKALRNLISGDK